MHPPNGVELSQPRQVSLCAHRDRRKDMPISSQSYPTCLRPALFVPEETPNNVNQSKLMRVVLLYQVVWHYLRLRVRRLHASFVVLVMVHLSSSANVLSAPRLSVWHAIGCGLSVRSKDTNKGATREMPASHANARAGVRASTWVEV